ncbi:MAG TPA: Mur ligase family protein, partial [Ktedonobacterales bacterium]|nr:Mur ligase family protein [Ktedonobacterales bacterium]
MAATQPAMQLTAFLERLPPGWGALQQAAADLGAITLTGVAEDSRRTQPGTLFVARAGRGSDGRRYIVGALAAGAVAVVGEWPLAELPGTLPPTVPYWQVADGREAFALLSAAFFDFPSRKLTIIGVTGTDGKTTTSSLVHRMLLNDGLHVGLITTISAIIDDRALDTGFHVTTPEAFDLQSYLAQMVEAGCTHAVVETTSHGLDQRRVAQVEYDIS